MVFTTKRLLSMALNSPNHIVADGKNKLNWINWPVFMIGTTDTNNTLHPYGILVTSHEEGEDFQFMFQTIKNLIYSIHQVNFKPTILVADSSVAITNGFEATFELIKRVYCWPLVKKEICKLLNSIQNKDIRDAIKEDIIQFQHHVEEEVNQREAYIMSKKWKELYKSTENSQEVNIFIKNLSNKWLHPNRRGWYEHFCEHSISDVLHATKKMLNDNGILKEIISVLHFVYWLENGMLKEWSKARALPIIEANENQEPIQPNNTKKRKNSEVESEVENVNVAEQESQTSTSAACASSVLRASARLNNQQSAKKAKLEVSPTKRVIKGGKKKSAK